MCLGVDVLIPRQLASIELNQVRGHDPWLKAESFQVGARRLVGYRRWSCGGQGRNQNPWCSSGPNLVNERPSEVVDEDLQLPHPCSPTCSPRSDFQICRVPSVSALLDSIIVTHSCMALQRRTSADSNVSRTISRELCFKLHGTPVQNYCSNTYTGFQSSRG